MSKVRVYEIAKQLGIDEGAALTLLQAQGAPVRNRLSAVEPDIVDRARRALERAKSASVVEERIRPTVVRRKATPKVSSDAIESAPASAAAPSSATRIPVAQSRGVVAPSNGHGPDAQPVSRHSRGEPVSARERESSREIPVARRVEEEHAPVSETREEPTREELPPSVVEAQVAPIVAEPVAAETTHAPHAAMHEAQTPTRDIVEPEPSSAPHMPSPPPPAEPVTRSTAPKTGIETWAGRPGVPMPQPVQTRSAAGRPAGVGGTTMQRRGVQYDPRRDASPPGRPGMGGGPVARGVGGARPGMAGRGAVGGAGVRNKAGAGPSTLRRPAAPPSEMAAHKKVIKIEENVTLSRLAAQMSLKATDVLMKLLSMGMAGVNINSTLDADTAKLLASEFGWEVSDVAVKEEDEIKAARGEEADAEGPIEMRPPVVTVMGHVDHGKTSLLDYIRKTTVAAGEAGGITQHIGAYRVKTDRGEICFLDTPGHEAFTQMRARGAQVTDLVILVVAADDGVMPQTREAVAHAKSAKVPIIVAVNKIDKPEADPARPRRELMELELVPEELGGETMFVDVSAKTGEGVETLLDAITLQAEMLELRAHPGRPASGTVIEAMLDRGKGPVARILVRDGTLHVGDVVLAGPAWGKVRAMTDENGRSVAAAGPATPVEVLGLSDVPNAGDPVDGVKDARKAQELAETRGAKAKRSLMPATAKVSLEDLAKRVAESGQLELRLIIKGDVQGSVEAVNDALQKLSTEKVKVTIVHSAVGAITEGDVNLAAAAKAIIIGFNVRPAGKASVLADTEAVEIRLYNIIYQAVDEVKKAMAGLLAPTIVEKFLGRAEVRQVFNISKVGTVAGCLVVDGTIKRAASKARLIRDSVQIWEGKIAGLRHLKEDRREVEKGFECGISLENYNDIKPGDVIEAVDVEEVAATL
jgi:translation initiation factor IF-2